MTAETSQFSLFEGSAPAGPEGLVYRPGFLSETEQVELVAQIAVLPFRAFEFHGFTGHRRTVSFGWRYAFDGSGLQKAERFPDFLLPIRARAAAWAGVEPAAFAHALVTEYAPGAAIGWHKDRSVFGLVAGISLLAAARLRFRKKSGASWQRWTLDAAPCSAYLLAGEARAEWEHSIPPMEALRYSVTFRTLRQ